MRSSPERTLLVFGDSLSAAYGLRADQGWAALLQKRLQTEGYGYRVVNASVSGETTCGWTRPLARALEQHKPAAGGAGTRRQRRPARPAGARHARANLEAMVDASRAGTAQGAAGWAS